MPEKNTESFKLGSPGSMLDLKWEFFSDKIYTLFLLERSQKLQYFIWTHSIVYGPVTAEDTVHAA